VGPVARQGVEQDARPGEPVGLRLVPYFDWASPTMLDTMGAQTQLLLAGKITPDQLVEACQKDYDAFRKTQGK